MMDIDDSRNIRREQDADYLEGLEQDIVNERRKALEHFHSIIAEAWRSLPQKAKSLVRLYQQSVGRSDPEIRKLFAMSNEEMEMLNSLSNSHLFSSSTTCCRNASDAYVQTMHSPHFTTLDSDIVLSFDASTDLRWTNFDNMPLAVANVPIQLSETSLTHLEVKLTIAESQIYWNQQQILSTRQKTIKRSQMDADESALTQAAQRLCLDEEEEARQQQMLLEEQMREWEMDLDE